MFGVVGEWQSERDKEKNYINNKKPNKIGTCAYFLQFQLQLGSEHCQL